MVGDVFGSLCCERYFFGRRTRYVTVEQLDDDLGDCRLAHRVAIVRSPADAQELGGIVRVVAGYFSLGLRWRSRQPRWVR